MQTNRPPHRFPVRPYQDIAVSTKAFEGFLIGAKCSVLHALLCAPFVSKEIALAYNTYKIVEYSR